MTSAAAIGVIGQVLTMSGIVSIRMFLPGFLYFLAMRLAVDYPRFAPETIAQMAAHTPAWQISWPFLSVFGLLACAELAAVRNPDVKEFLVEDFDRYAKPVMSILLALGAVSAAQSDEVRQLLDGAPPTQAAVGGFALVMAAVAASMTGFCCQLRATILEKIRSIDPDNSIGLQGIANGAGEVVLVAALLLLLLAPVLALALTVGGVLAGMWFKRLWGLYEDQHIHPCAACAEKGVTTQVSDCAFVCPVCGADQPDVCRVGWFGFSTSDPLDGMPPEKHAFHLLAARRCRWCASPLTGALTCEKCGRPQWEESFGSYYVSRTDVRCALLLGVAVLSFLYPVGGLVLTLIFFRPLAVRPLAVHLGGGTRFLVSFMSMLVRLLLLVPLLLLSLIPFLGLVTLIPFLIRYGFVRRAFLRRLGIKK